MQQFFSAFGVSWSLLVAQGVNFAIVLIILWYFLYKPGLAMLDKRREIVAKGLRDAEQAEEMFANADAEIEGRMKSADTEAEKIVSVARESANVEKARLLKEAEDRAAFIAKDAQERATETVASARRESEHEIARIAVLATEKILRESV